MPAYLKDMFVRRVIILDLEKNEIRFEDARDLHELRQGTLMKTISEWETQLNWGHLSLKTPSQAATPQYLQRGLVMASSIGLPQVLVTESSAKEEDLSPRSHDWSRWAYKKLEAKEKKEKLLKSMKVDFTGEVIVVEEALPVFELNWSPAPKRKRPRKRKV
ncbi:hypothetical protein AMTR_s00055p00094360 [Amborella trichopoda]|uniref:Uncharacterized protein n=1 Tax=Amborella trichopoda TaxID=13333 RepID=U5D706_AMBTC|nr:hypothetical protein AMTR_s00055p00094360 [Amborella trichopoda]